MTKSDKAHIMVRFDSGPNAPDTADLPRYLPGDAISGTIQVIPTEELHCKKLLVRLKWRTEGRGDTDQAIIAERDLFQGTLTPTNGFYAPFAFTLPREPWSYAGHFITIVWGIEVDVDVPWKVNPRHFAPFLLAPAWAQGDR